MRMLIVISAALVALAGPGVAAAQEPFAALPGKASATESGKQVALRVLPMLEPGSRAGRNARPPAGVSNASLLLERGVFRPLPDVSGALQTTHLRNNNRGQVVGAYADDADGTPRLRGFLMEKRRLTRIDVPGAVITLPLGINDQGQVVGGWVGPDATVNPVTGETGPVHGFLWDRGRYTKFDVPGATTTGPYEINNRGQIVGNYTDASGAQHGFVMRNGRVTTIDHPRAAQAANLTGTRVVGIDDRGRLVGSYGDDAGLIHAWTWEDGRFTDVEPPGGLQAEASEIDNRGRVVGRYLDATPKLRSFLLDRGRYKRIDAPGRCDTAALGLNDRGQILIAAAGTTVGTTCPPQDR
jgi:probable HAF family extracellular repeat protein